MSWILEYALKVSVSAPIATASPSLDAESETSLEQGLGKLLKFEPSKVVESKCWHGQNPTEQDGGKAIRVIARGRGSMLASGRGGAGHPARPGAQCVRRRSSNTAGAPLLALRASN